MDCFIKFSKDRLIYKIMDCRAGKPARNDKVLTLNFYEILLFVICIIENSNPTFACLL